MAGGDGLTLDVLRATQAMLESKLAAEDADAFIRLGEEGFKGYRILKHGGLVVVGGHERGGSRGAEYVALIRRSAPDVRVQLTEFLPDGVIYLLETPSLLRSLFQPFQE